MSNIDETAKTLILNSIQNVFTESTIEEPIAEETPAEKLRREVAEKIAQDLQERKEATKMYKSGDATTSDEKETTIKEKKVKNTITINPTIEEEIAQLATEQMIVTNADKKGNTPAYQNYKKGMKGKDGKPMYKAADHMKEEKGKEKNCGCGQDPCITYGKQDSNSMKEGYGKGVKMADLPKGSKVGSKKVDMPKGSKKKVGHDCASKVKHESYGIGDCIKEMHTLDRFGNITHYDVMFGEQLIKNVPVAHLDIVSEMHHEHYINDDKNAEVLGEKKAAKDYDGDGKIESGKDEYFGSKDKAIKKAMASRKEQLELTGKFTAEEIEGILEADRLGKLEESEKVAQGAYKRAQELGAKRRSKQGVNRGIGKNERAGYNLSQAARSRNASLETQGGNQTGGGSKSFGYAKNKSNPVKSKSTGDTGATGHYKKRDEKVTSKSGKTTRYKLKFADRMNAPVSRRQELKDPKKNPKHTANK